MAPPPVPASVLISGPISGSHHRDGFPGVHEDRVAHAGRHQGDADGLLACAGIDHGHLVRQQPHHPDLNGRVRARDADLFFAFARLRPAFEARPSLVARPSLLSPGRAAGLWLTHATTPGPSTPGCSKNTCTS